MFHKGYEFFEHTADVGVRAYAKTLPELLVALARGLTELVVEDSVCEPREVRTIVLEAPDAAGLVLAWLKELLFWFSSGKFVPVEYTFEDVTPQRVRGVIRGERFDPDRHTYGTEVKGITRHQLVIEETHGRWSAQVIFDV